ncbi:MAG TPA: HD domain-containing protein [Candidatus Krumholzibacteria bacterium]|nr:HD domain-containing protein [Candidatus Krumholzibacteria bacterium]
MTLSAWQEDIIRQGELYRVGGSVRDRLLGLDDVVDTDYLVRGIDPATLESILSRHGRVVLVGKVFGVYHFTPLGEPACDIAFPRTEVSTGPGHRDFTIQTDWRLPVEADLRRRDFTINAIAERIPGHERIDPLGGESDLREHRLRMIFPEAFTEDPLRILRGARFAARFELAATAATQDAMKAAAPLLSTVSAERVQEEFSKTLTQCETPGNAFDILHRCDGLSAVFPELSRCVGVTQNEYHPDDVYWHTLKVCNAAPRTSLMVRWAALLHDLGKVDTRQIVHDDTGERVVFYGHEVISAEIAERVLDRLRYPRAFITNCAHLVREHMYRYESAWKPATVRRFMARVGTESLDDLFALREADCRSRDLTDELASLAELRSRVQVELRDRSGVHLKDLAVGGEDVMRELGLAPGPAVGDVLQRLFERVLDSPELNERETLVALMREELDRDKGAGR